MLTFPLGAVLALGLILYLSHNSAGMHFSVVMLLGVLGLLPKCQFLMKFSLGTDGI